MRSEPVPLRRPNLFAFGRSELSQDAFLCWLLAWADRGLTLHARPWMQ